MKYQKGDIVKWSDYAFDPKENIMIVNEVVPIDSISRSGTEQYYYRYTYLETGRQDSYMGTLYESDTFLMA